LLEVAAQLGAVVKPGDSDEPVYSIELGGAGQDGIDLLDLPEYLDEAGFDIMGGDPDLDGQPWRPKIYRSCGVKAPPFRAGDET
jgi:hypothetical protein